MARLTNGIKGEHFQDHTLNMKDGDRVRIELDGGYVTYMRYINNRLTMLDADELDLIF